MAKIDDLMQRRAEQVIPAIVLRLAHRTLQPRSATGSNLEAKRLKAREEENAKLKKLLAEQMIDGRALRELLSKKNGRARRQARRSRISGSHGPVGTAGLKSLGAAI
jgi:hypothetical protein